MSNKAKEVIEADRAEAVELTNDQLLAKISKHNEEIKKLKAMLKPTPPLKIMDIAECNKGMRERRMAKFAKQDELNSALASVIAKEVKPKAKAK
jgi:hypothetical protein